MADVPLGVIILSVLNLLAGVLILVGSFNFLGPLSWLFAGTYLMSLPHGATIVGLLYVLIGLGLLALASWAWWLDMIFVLINIIILLLDFPAVAWIPLIVNVIIVLYLNQGSIRRRFDV